MLWHPRFFYIFMLLTVERVVLVIVLVVKAVVTIHVADVLVNVKVVKVLVVDSVYLGAAVVHRAQVHVIMHVTVSVGVIV